MKGKAVVLATPGELTKVSIIESMIVKWGRILDLGCGAGICISALAKHGEVIGLDISMDSLRNAKENFRGVDFVAGDAQCLPFRSSIFDVVVAKDMLEHVKDDRKVIGEISRISSSNAELAIYLPHSLSEARFSIEGLVYKLTGYSIDGFVGHERRYYPRDALALLSEAGFKASKIHYFAHVVSSLFTILYVLGGALLKKKMGEVRSPRASAALTSFLEPACLLEYRLMGKFPGATIFMHTRKSH